MLYGFFYIYNCQRRDYNIDWLNIKEFYVLSFLLEFYHSFSLSLKHQHIKN